MVSGVGIVLPVVASPADSRLVFSTALDLDRFVRDDACGRAARRSVSRPAVQANTLILDMVVQSKIWSWKSTERSDADFDAYNKPALVPPRPSPGAGSTHDTSLNEQMEPDYDPRPFK